MAPCAVLVVKMLSLTELGHFTAVFRNYAAPAMLGSGIPVNILALFWTVLCPRIYPAYENFQISPLSSEPVRVSPDMPVPFPDFAASERGHGRHGNKRGFFSSGRGGG